MPFDCRTCGACCSYSQDWPRFTLETDAEIAAIPAALAAPAGMRCDRDRCAALVGNVGDAVSCAAYAVRPQVCRECVPGDEACVMARARFGLGT